MYENKPKITPEIFVTKGLIKDYLA